MSSPNFLSLCVLHVLHAHCEFDCKSIIPWRRQRKGKKAPEYVIIFVREREKKKKCSLLSAFTEQKPICSFSCLTFTHTVRSLILTFLRLSGSAISRVWLTAAYGEFLQRGNNVSLNLWGGGNRKVFCWAAISQWQGQDMQPIEMH